jgi:hypothetical protein
MLGVFLDKVRVNRGRAILRKLRRVLPFVGGTCLVVGSITHSPVAAVGFVLLFWWAVPFMSDEATEQKTARARQRGMKVLDKQMSTRSRGQQSRRD